MKKTCSKRILTASEINQFVYCPMAWWLNHVKRVRPTPEMRERVERGVEAHRENGILVETERLTRKAGSTAAYTFVVLLGLILVARYCFVPGGG